MRSYSKAMLRSYNKTRNYASFLWSYNTLSLLRERTVYLVGRNLFRTSNVPEFIYKKVEEK